MTSLQGPWLVELAAAPVVDRAEMAARSVIRGAVGYSCKGMSELGDRPGVIHNNISSKFFLPMNLTRNPNRQTSFWLQPKHGQNRDSQG